MCISEGIALTVFSSLCREGYTTLARHLVEDVLKGTSSISEDISCVRFRGVQTGYVIYKLHFELID
jgi:hypothetical protein